LIAKRAKRAIIVSQKNATHRAARPDPSLRKERSFRMTIKLHCHLKIGKKEVTQVEQYTITGKRRTFPPLMVTELSLLPVEAASEFP
jgi:hypothetical protein